LRCAHACSILVPVLPRRTAVQHFQVLPCTLFTATHRLFTRGLRATAFFAYFGTLLNRYILSAHFWIAELFRFTGLYQVGCHVHQVPEPLLSRGSSLRLAVMVSDLRTFFCTPSWTTYKLYTLDTAHFVPFEHWTSPVHHWDCLSFLLQFFHIVCLDFLFYIFFSVPHILHSFHSLDVLSFVLSHLFSHSLFFHT